MRCGSWATKRKKREFLYSLILPTGYFDAFFYSLLLEVGGPDFYNKAMTYEDEIWESPEATKGI